MKSVLLALATIFSLALAAPAPQSGFESFVGDVEATDNVDRSQIATEVGENAEGQREFLQDGVFPASCGNGGVAVEPCVFVDEPSGGN
ncbi:hypothetical protein GTA08_BOTSDO02637 [Neofusicoccum parvum]|nr:hypothetical protein GTA08_BOTSDO02637 [Neofusicoccum parvum]